MTAQPAYDKNGKLYGYHCTSGNHLWTKKEDAEKCCDGVHHRILIGCQMRPYRAWYGWVP
jgi:hypothetical protein